MHLKVYKPFTPCQSAGLNFNHKMKYELTKNTKQVQGGVLYQIRALTSFRDVEEGEVGGWVQKEQNLSQTGNSWVQGNAVVCGDAVAAMLPVYHGTNHSANFCKKGVLRIGCYEFPVSEWFKRFREIGEEEGYSPKQIEEYLLAIKLLSMSGDVFTKKDKAT